MALDAGMGIGGVIWWMGGLIRVPGLLWMAWTLMGRRPMNIADEPGRDAAPGEAIAAVDMAED